VPKWRLVATTNVIPIHPERDPANQNAAKNRASNAIRKRATRAKTKTAAVAISNCNAKALRFCANPSI